jgi:hypothetical protein
MFRDFGTGFRQRPRKFLGSMAILPTFRTRAAKPSEYFQLLTEKNKRSDSCCRATRSPSPMWIRESERCVHWNWTAIFSYTAALAVSLAIWRGLFRTVEFLVR